MLNINKPKIEEKIGKDLSEEIIKLMVDNRIQEYGENTKDFKNNEQESIFFFVKKDNEIKAFGLLKPVTIYFSSREYKIMGIGNIMALEKGKGYGKVIMDHVKKYLEKHNFVGIGNSYKDNFEFYKKCGFTLIPGFIDRFVDLDKSGKEHRGDWAEYSMFIYDKHHSLDSVINGKGEITVKIPLW